MTLKFSKAELTELLELYYRETENSDVKINATVESARLGYGMGEYDGCRVTIIAQGTISLLGKNHPFEKKLSEEEVLKMSTTMLTQAGLEISSAKLDSGTKKETIGFGMGETTVHKPYFHGLIVEAEKKLEKVK